MSYGTISSNSYHKIRCFARKSERAISELSIHCMARWRIISQATGELFSTITIPWKVPITIISNAALNG